MNGVYPQTSGHPSIPVLTSSLTGCLATCSYDWPPSTLRSLNYHLQASSQLLQKVKMEASREDCLYHAGHFCTLIHPACAAPLTQPLDSSPSHTSHAWCLLHVTHSLMPHLLPVWHFWNTPACSLQLVLCFCIAFLTLPHTLAHSPIQQQPFNCLQAWDLQLPASFPPILVMGSQQEVA